MFGFPSWIMLLVVAVVAAGGAAYVTEEVYTGKIAKIELKHANDLTKQSDEATALLLASKDAARTTERTMYAETSRLESENATLQGQLVGTRLANGRLIDAACGLYDRNGRLVAGGAGSADGAGGAAATPLSAQGRPAACDIPEKVLAAIREFGSAVADLLLEADQDAATAATGIGYADTITKLLGVPKPVAPATP